MKPQSETEDEFVTGVLAAYPEAFDFYGRLDRLVEDSIEKPRKHANDAARATELLFLQAYKSFRSIGLLGTRGMPEDAATLARRLLEIVWQLLYLVNGDSEANEQRAKHCIAYAFAFWPQLQEELGERMSADEVESWQSIYDEHKEFIAYKMNGQPRNWWPAVDDNGNATRARGNLRDLSVLAGVSDSYDGDYGHLSQMTHASMAGNLMTIQGGKAEVQTKKLVDTFVVWGSSYMVTALRCWNAVFELIPDDEVRSFQDEIVALKRRMRNETGEQDA